MQNELNNQCIECVRTICSKNFINFDQVSIEWINDYVEIKIFHPENPNRYVSVSTQNFEILVDIEFNHLHFPEFSGPNNVTDINDLIYSLTDILDKYLSGSISSFCAKSKTRCIVGGHRTSPIDKNDIKKSFKNVKRIEICNWSNPEIEIIDI